VVVRAQEENREGHGAATEPIGLRAGAIGLTQNVVIGMATSAPALGMATVLAPIVAATAYGTVLPLLFGMATMLCIALAYQRLNMWSQNSGGAYHWVGRAVHPYVGFMVGWTMLGAFVVTSFYNVLAIGPALLSLLGLDESSKLGTGSAGLVLIVAMTYLAARGIGASARLQMLLAVIEYAILAVIGSWAAYTVFFAHSAGTVSPSWSWLSVSGDHSAGSFTGGVLLGVFMMAGWDTAVYVSEEAEAPAKNPGKAAVLGVLVLGVFYILLTLAFQGVAPLGALERHSADGVIFASGRIAGSAGRVVMGTAVVLSVVATTQACLVAPARIMYAMARDEVLWKRLGRIHPTHRTPAFATTAVGVLTGVVLLLSLLSNSVSGAVSTLIAVTAVLFAIYYVLTAAATTWFYRRRVLASPADFVLGGLLPVTGAVGLGWVTVKSIESLEKNALIDGAVVLALGVIAMLGAAVIYRPAFFRMRPEAAAAEPRPRRAETVGTARCDQ
jgi:amino acid transporter